VEISGVPTLIQDYPDYSIHGKIEQPLSSWLKVWASYTRAQYKIGDAGAADSYGLGTGIFLSSLRATFEATDYSPSHGSTNHYLSFGVGLGF